MEGAESEFTELEYIQVELPDIDETQIWDSPGDVREVTLYLQTKNGKIDGAENAPFELPHRWTYNTLKMCIQDYIARIREIDEKENIQIDQLYFKKNGRSKAVVAVNSDHDIPAMLNEYPLEYPSGKKKTGRHASIVMAVDWSLKCSSFSPRRSPRLASKSRSTSQQCEHDGFEVFVFEVLKGMNLSKTSEVLHGIPQSCNLETLQKKLKELEGSKVFVPTKGLFWLRKGKKQMVQLQSEHDWQSCRKEYSDAKGNIGSVRIACVAVNIDLSESAHANSSSTRKRCLEFTTPNENNSKSKKSQGENELWNDIHCSIVRDLEKKGSLNRYGVKHLKLWTDLVIEGKSCGIGDEPRWEEYINQIGVPPKSPRELTSSASTKPTSSTDDLLKAMILQNQQRLELETKRAETFQNSLMAIMAAALPMFQQQTSGKPPQSHQGGSETASTCTTPQENRFSLP